MTNPVIIGDATLYLGDCLEILPTLPKADAVITDPPYGLNLGGSESRVSDGRYVSYADSWEEFLRLVPTALSVSLAMSKRGACFMAGKSLCGLPRPTAVGGVYCPSGAGTTAWGFTCFHPVAFYGTAPWASKGLRPNVFYSTEVSEKNGHPCPKPLGWMKWLVDFASAGDVIDPFMGSGTTGVACMNLGRMFIGIEIEPKYFDIACERIENAQRQPRLFEDKPLKVEQLEL